ncbi:hypothetical protein EV421DRAFT_1913490 [Armillaria borealis]|uniref:Uncharacterized protein n=1 Tax=Armillaria borealis TaxID=47425 RepID=A0AA39IUL7_9AGAR|nr:hypothetical protein EV421DRAFT_1913490 [Armillaria borealis]
MLAVEQYNIFKSCSFAQSKSLLPSSRSVMFNKSSISGITLEPAGLVALADLPTVAVRTALMGTASWLDILVLAPGMHQQQFADENPATVSYLQRIGHIGYLVTAVVERKQNSTGPKNPYFNLSPPQYHTFYTAGFSVALLYLLCPILTIIVFALVGSIRDWWALAVLGMLVLSRTINVFVIKRRASDSSVWKGAEEEGRGDLLVVLSQDRWIRLQGDISDLRDEDRVESLAVGVATLLVYAAAALAGNASTIGSLLIACLLLCSVALLSLCNSFTHCLQMYDCIVQEGKTPRKRYGRRLEMVKALVEEVKKGGEQECESGAWAINMQLIQKIQELDKISLPEGTLTTDYSKEPKPSDSVSISTVAAMC